MSRSHFSKWQGTGNDFILFDGGVKKLPRVHQYLGIKAAQEHVRQRKGGIIWHTQGSGKSIVMVLLAKWILENNPNARVAIITDRDELDKQIERVFTEAGEPIKKHTHVIFFFFFGRQLRYLDVRKFGKFTLLPIEKRDEYEPFKKMGPEPIADFFNLSKFKKDLSKSHRAIKAVILDQNIVAGVGNIYADESLFQAKIHPLQAADTIGPAAAKRLHEAVMDVISRSVEAGGSTIRTYKNTLGEAGKFQVSLAVYGQTGQPCPNCGHPIEKIRVAQRGTHYCPHCQQLPKTRSKAPDITDIAYEGAK